MRRLAVFLVVVAVSLALAPTAGAAKPAHWMGEVEWGPWEFAAGEVCDVAVGYHSLETWNMITWGDPEDPDRIILHIHTDARITNLETGLSVYEDVHWSEMVDVGPADVRDIGESRRFAPDGTVIDHTAGQSWFTENWDAVRSTPGTATDFDACTVLEG
jgi:hypothetical protein